MWKAVLATFMIDSGLVGMKRCVGLPSWGFMLRDTFTKTAECHKIHNLKYLLDEPASTATDFLFLNPSFTYQSELLSQSQGDFLVQSYVLYVDPFIRLSHKPRLLFELNRFAEGYCRIEKSSRVSFLSCTH